MRVMVVDDSVVFRSQLKSCLDGHDGIEVISTAANGKIALDRLEQSQCDLITLDLEMPEMNGMEFLAEKKRRKLSQKVIVFAAPNEEGRVQVLDALALGADDFIAKPKGVGSLEEALDGIKRELLPKVLQFKNERMSEALAKTVERLNVAARPEELRRPLESYARVTLETFKPRLVVIASSTGGPVVLEKIFSNLKGRAVNVPILITQHMPPLFTDSLAKRLERLSGIPTAEGKNAEPIKSGRVYVAPGDFHMSLIRGSDSQVMLKVDQGPKRNSVRPAADFLFESAAREYRNHVAGFVLTGMGEDGKDGAVAIKRSHGGIMIQDQASSVVWGMPSAVQALGAYDHEGDVEECARILAMLVS